MFYEAVERFRNNLRLNKTTTKAQHSYTTFITLQDEEDTANSVNSVKTVRSETKKRNNCLCKEKHYFSECPYLIVQNRIKN